MPIFDTSPVRPIRKAPKLGVNPFDETGRTDTQGIQAFLGAVGNYGVAKSNKFSIISLPRLTEDKDRVLASLYAESVDIPGKFVNTVPTKIQGKSMELPAEFSYSGTLNVTFLVDIRMQLRRYFEWWLYQVCPNGENTSFSPAIPESYFYDLQINMIDYLSKPRSGAPTAGLSFQSFVDDPLGSLRSAAVSAGGTISSAFMDSLRGNANMRAPADTTAVEVGTYMFKRCYPKSISGAQLNQGSREYQRIQVSFAFDIMTSTYRYATPTWIDQAAPLNQGTGFGIIGSIAGHAGSLGATINGVGNSVIGIPDQLKRLIG